MQLPDTEFHPNLVNTVCYFVGTVVQLSTFAVNYVGEPFTTPLSANTGLALSLRYMAAFLFLLALDLFPGDFGSYFGLVPLPQGLKWQVVGGSLALFCFSWALEHGLRALLPVVPPPAKGYQAFGPNRPPRRLPASHAPMVTSGAGADADAVAADSPGISAAGGTLSAADKKRQ